MALILHCSLVWFPYTLCFKANDAKPSQAQKCKQSHVSMSTSTTEHPSSSQLLNSLNEGIPPRDSQQHWSNPISLKDQLKSSFTSCWPRAITVSPESCEAVSLGRCSPQNQISAISHPTQELPSPRILLLSLNLILKHLWNMGRITILSYLHWQFYTFMECNVLLGYTLGIRIK